MKKADTSEGYVSREEHEKLVTSTNGLLLTIKELRKNVNQEVERRISERMSDEEIRIIAFNYAPPLMYSMGDRDEDVHYSIRNDVIEILTKLRSRLLEKPNNCTGGEG